MDTGQEQVLCSVLLILHLITEYRVVIRYLCFTVVATYN